MLARICVGICGRISFDYAQDRPATGRRRGKATLPARSVRHARRLGVSTLVIFVCLAMLAGQVLAGPGDVGGAGSSAYLQQQFKLNAGGAVNSISGAATYSYPIRVPLGTGGIQPDLALAYDSQAAWGLLGYGWSIVGLDGISRSTKKGVPRYDSSDTFVWGGEDLIYHTDGYYHTRHESYNRIQAYNCCGAGSYWIVTGKDGTQYRYGYNANSRIEAVDKSGQVRVWALDRVTNANGNYMTISYLKDTANGDYYPDLITYTYNDAGGISAYRTVKFNWQARTDVHTSYAEGALVKIDQRLVNTSTPAAIEVKINGQLVRKYVLSYTTGSGGKSLLSEIEECGTNGTTCLPPTQFAYQALNAGFGAEHSWSVGSDTECGASYVRSFEPYMSDYATWYDWWDMDGDGLPDKAGLGDFSFDIRVWPNTGSAFGSPQNHLYKGMLHMRRDDGGGTKRDIMDMNGDGFQDVVDATYEGVFLIL